MNTIFKSTFVCLKQYPYRVLTGFLIAILFCISGVLVPLLVDQHNYVHLISTWGCMHVLGRFQVLLLWPVWQKHKKTMLFESICVREVLSSEAEKRREIATEVWKAGRVIRALEVLLIQIVPQALGLIIRVGVICYLFPQQGSWALLTMFTSLIGLVYLGKNMKPIHLKLINDEIDYEKLQQEALYQKIYLASSTKPSLHKQQAMISGYIKQELYKLAIAFWLIVVLIVGICCNYHSKRILPMLMWIGFADHIWGIWQGVKECMVCEEADKPEPTKQHHIINIILEGLLVWQKSPSIDLMLFRGQILHIKGENGVGKTSLLKVILGTSEPYSGKVMSDGITGAIYKQNACFVLSHQTLLLTGAVSDYINPDALSEVGLLGVLMALPKGINSELGVLQKEWSLGMLQKLNLAYALSQRADLYILDEACNHQSLQSELSFYEALCRQPQKPIIVLVSHQLAAARMTINGCRSLTLKAC